MAFEYDGDETLSVKIFCAYGGREDCCMESDSSSCYDEEDEDEDEEDSLSVKAERSLLPWKRGDGTEVAPPKMSLTSFLAASSTYFWK